jgi:heat shock protein HslJ
MNHPDVLIGLWNVVELRGGDGALVAPIDGSRIRAKFDEAGSVMGDAGCNSYRGSYRTQDGAITVEMVATTRRLCVRPPGVMEQEAGYLEVLAAATAYTIGTGGTLRLFNDAGEVLIVMDRVVD